MTVYSFWNLASRKTLTSDTNIFIWFEKKYLYFFRRVQHTYLESFWAPLSSLSIIPYLSQYPPLVGYWPSNLNDFTPLIFKVFICDNQSIIFTHQKAIRVLYSSPSLLVSFRNIHSLQGSILNPVKQRVYRSMNQWYMAMTRCGTEVKNGSDRWVSQ